MFSNLGSKGNYIAMPWNEHQDTLIWQKYIIMVLIKNFGEDQGSLLEASSLLSSTSRAILECFLLFPAILLWNIKWFSVWIRVYISMRHTEKKKKQFHYRYLGVHETLSVHCFDYIAFRLNHYFQHTDPQWRRRSTEKPGL